MLAVLALMSLAACQTRIEPSAPELWVWVHDSKANQAEGWPAVFDKLAESGVHGVLFGGEVDRLKEIVPIATERGVEVHAWFWTMNRRDAKPEWLSVNRDGDSLADKMAYVDYYQFMCPALPEVREHIKNNIRKLATVEGLKGLHMDYVRYVDVILPAAIQPNYNLVQDHEFPEFDYGYHPYMRELYREKFGVDPMDIADPENDQRWKQFRYDQVTEAVLEIEELANSLGLQLSAAVFPTPDIARKLVRQDWDKWPIDSVFPMMYHEFYNKEMDWLDTATRQGVSSLDADQELIAGLFSATYKKSGELTAAINLTLSAGAKGVALFDYQSMQDHHWAEIRLIANGCNAQGAAQ